VRSYRVCESVLTWQRVWVSSDLTEGVSQFWPYRGCESVLTLQRVWVSSDLTEGVSQFWPYRGCESVLTLQRVWVSSDLTETQLQLHYKEHLFISLWGNDAYWFFSGTKHMKYAVFLMLQWVVLKITIAAERVKTQIWLLCLVPRSVVRFVKETNQKWCPCFGRFSWVVVKSSERHCNIVLQFCSFCFIVYHVSSCVFVFCFLFALL